MRIAELKRTISARFTPDTPGNTLSITKIGIGKAGAGIAWMVVIDGAVYAAKTAGIFLQYQIGMHWCINSKANCNYQEPKQML